MRKLVAIMMMLLIVSLPLTLAEISNTAEETILEVTLPDYYNKQSIDIFGKTSPNANVVLYVNGQIARINDPTFTGAEGRVAFYGVSLLVGENTVRIVANEKKEVKKKIIVDVKDPVLTIAPFRNVSIVKNLTVTATASEPGSLNIYYKFKKGGDKTPPPKITGLRAEEVKDSSVKLGWNATDEEDFSKYLVYRKDVGIIAAVSSQRNPSYADNRVEPSKKYTYEVSAIDKANNEGEHSDALEVETLAGEARSVERPRPINISEVITSPLKGSINASGTFTFTFNLEEGDGDYIITFELADKAGNKDKVEKEVLLDTKPPKIELISPRQGDFVFENFADQVTFTGKTEPFAKVFLYIERSPFGGSLNTSIDVAGLSERLETLPDSALKSDCTYSVTKKRQCTGADYSTTADADGNFKIEDVDLTSIAALGININEVSPTDFGTVAGQGSETARGIEAGRSRSAAIKVNMLFIALDKAGKKGAKQSHINVGNCWSGDFKFDAIPIIEAQSPTFLSPERIAEGTEEIVFAFNISKTTDENLAIKSVQMQNACDDVTRNHPLTNLSCQLLGGGCNLKAFAPGSSMYYSVCKLKRHAGLSTWSKANWEGFFKSLKGHELVFPFKVSVLYTETLPLEDVISSEGAEGRTSYMPENAARATVQTVSGVQTMCQTLSYTIDNSMINPQEVLPDWMLYDAVKWLNESIAFMTKAQEYVGDALKIAGVGCGSSIILMFVTGVYRRWSCSFESGMKELEKITDKLSQEDKDRMDECRTCLLESELDGYEVKDGTRQKVITEQNWRDVKAKDMSDTCLNKCYPSCAGGWSTESSIYTGMRWMCDRFAGHPTPSKWTEDKPDKELYSKATKIADSCHSDAGVSGVPLKVEKCSILAAEFKVKDDFQPTDVCIEGRNQNNQPTMYLVGNKLPQDDDNDGNVWELKTKLGEGWSWDNRKIAIKVDDDNYLTNKAESCESLCAGKSKKKPKPKIVKDEGKLKVSKEPGEDAPTGICYTSSKCAALPLIEDEVLTGFDPKEVDTWRMGYTSDCFYISSDGQHNVQNNPNKREECCCVSLKGEGRKGTEYYQPSDIEHKDFPDQDKPKTAEEGDGEIETKDGEEIRNEKFKDMQFSYRYMREKWVAPSGANAYNPHRYISGRDLPACFGQNNWVYDEILGSESVLKLDPSKELTSAFQCLAINQIYARLTQLKSMMVALQGCLITIRTTGKADSGVCKEFFTRYVCSTIWGLIQAIKDKCTTVDLASFTGDLEIGDYFSKGLEGIFGSVEDTQKLMADEYNNVVMNDFLGVGEEAFARKVCLAAFGYDWELSFENFMDVAYTTPYATLVQPVTASRRYLGYNPKNGKARYEYRASWIINPGCDMNDYDVYLACVTSQELGEPGVDCSVQDDPAESNCDCINGKPQTQFLLKDGSRVKQGELLSQDAHDIPPDAQQRYDHLKFVLKPNTKIKGNLKSSCFPEGHEDGVFYFPIKDRTEQDLADCRVDVQSGVFACNQGLAFMGTKGTATIEGIKLRLSVPNIESGTREYGPVRATDSITTAYFEDTLEVNPIINRGVGPDVCLVMDVEDESGVINPLPPIGITSQSSNEYGYFSFGQLSEITGNVLAIDSKNRDKFRLKYQGTPVQDQNGKIVDIQFIKNPPAAGDIDFTSSSSDSIKISFINDETKQISEINNGGVPDPTTGKPILNIGNFFNVDISLIIDGTKISQSDKLTIRVANAPSTGSKKLHLRLYYLTDDAEGKFYVGEDCDQSAAIPGGTNTFPIRVTKRPVEVCAYINAENAEQKPCRCKGDLSVICQNGEYCSTGSDGKPKCDKNKPAVAAT